MPRLSKDNSSFFPNGTVSGQLLPPDAQVEVIAMTCDALMGTAMVFAHINHIAYHNFAVSDRIHILGNIGISMAPP